MEGYTYDTFAIESHLQMSINSTDKGHLRPMQSDNDIHCTTLE